MKKMLILLALLALFAVAGCGGGSQDTQAEAAKTTEAPADTAPVSEHPTAEHPTAETQLAAHDCDGGCGMTNVPMAQLTEIDGKYYCAGCAKSLKSDEDHSGHNH